LALLRMSVLKLDSLRTLAVAWLEDILAAGRGEDLEAVVTDVPKGAGRIVLTAHWDAPVEDFVERHARRAPMLQLSQGGPVVLREGSDGGTGEVRVSTSHGDEAGTVASVAYVLCPASARAAALQTVLDEVDPPSALVYVRSDEAERDVQEMLHALGYDTHPSVRLTRGDVTEHASLVILFDLPHGPAEWRAATASHPARVVALLAPRMLGQLGALAGVAVAPLPFAAPLDAARAREAQMRADLRRELSAGTPARELLALEPLLAEFDGAALAAAALRLLDRERTSRAPADTVTAQPHRDRQERQPDYRRERSRGDRGTRDGGGASRGERSSSPDRRGRFPPARAGGDRGGQRDSPSGHSRGSHRDEARRDTRRPSDAKPLPRSPR
jgi:hypothetical protein